jgi:hypothetical protein
LHDVVFTVPPFYIELRKRTRNRMTLSHETTHLLDEVEKHAQGRLLRRSELGLLFEIARSHNRWQTLDELSFFAKFAHKAHGILKRIGKDADGFDKLTHELSDSVERCTVLIRALLDHADDNMKNTWDTTFLAITPVTLQTLLSLLHDLSCYKNYNLDLRNQRAT